MSFNFGPATTTTGFAFGATTTATFGGSQANAQAFAPQSTTTFGTAQTNAPSFAPQPTAAFGTGQTNAPAFGAAQPGFGAAQPSFGAAQPSFGAAQPSFGAAQPSFGAAQPSFGASQPSFGATQPSFGAIPSTLPQTTLGQTTFGAPVTTGTTIAAPSFGFNSATPTTQPPAFSSFGLTNTQPTMPTFGSTATTTTTPAQLATTLGLSFTGLSKPATTGVSFGSTTTAATLPAFGNLGTTTASVNPTANPMTMTPASAATGFGFSTQAGQLNFGATPTTTSSTLGDGGLFGLKATPALSFNTTTSNVSFGTGTTSTSTASQSAPKVGLGGFDVSASQPKTVEGRSESIRAKDSILPHEILSTVELLRPHIKQQKTMSSNIARTSTRNLFNVSKELQNCDLKLSEISNYVANNYAAIKSLRVETAGAIRHAEMAQRTHETPPGLQFENTAPLKYFLDLVQKFESDMLTFRNQVTLTEKHIRSLTNPQGFTTAEDLKKGLQQMHESFVSLAGRVHETHQKVEALKEQYLNLRKHKLKDNSNVFEEKQTANNNKSTNMGPTPFSTLVGPNINMNYVPNQAAWTQTQPNQENLFGIGQSNFGTSTLGTGNAFGSINSGDGGFSLQKPPLGLKRNKH